MNIVAKILSKISADKIAKATFKKKKKIVGKLTLPDFRTYYKTASKSLQSCPTLCDPIDGSPPGSPVSWDSPSKNTGVGCHFFL